VAHPKLYLFDTGVFRSLRPGGPLDRPEEIEGAALEGLVAQHLRAWIAYSATVRSDDVRALRTFVADYPSCEPLLLYRGADRLVVNGVRCVPVEEFLRTLRPGRGMGEG